MIRNVFKKVAYLSAMQSPDTKTIFYVLNDASMNGRFDRPELFRSTNKEDARHWGEVHGFRVKVPKENK